MFLPPSPYIITLYEVYESEEYLILIFEYMNKKDLYANCVKVRPLLSEQQAFDYFSSILKGIYFLHNNGVCHRDLKPDNILLNSENQIKIADFSLADYYKNHMSGVCGTPGFIAPEMFYHDHYNEKVDVFSLGIIFYLMY